MPIYTPEPGPTGIVVDCEYYAKTLVPHGRRWTAKPRIVVNGQEIPETTWRTTHIPVPPGIHHVRVGTIPHRVLKIVAPPAGVTNVQDFGFADAMIPVREDHRTTTHYQSPSVFFHPDGPAAPLDMTNRPTRCGIRFRPTAVRWSAEQTPDHAVGQQPSVIGEDQTSPR